MASNLTLLTLNTLLLTFCLSAVAGCLGVMASLLLWCQPDSLESRMNLKECKAYVLKVTRWAFVVTFLVSLFPIFHLNKILLSVLGVQ